MDNFGTSLKNGPSLDYVGGPGVVDVMRAFPDLARRIAIGQEAACAANAELGEMMGRLGIQSNYGSAKGAVVQVDTVGDIEALARSIDWLTDTIRDIRGFAETLNSKL